MLFQRPSVIISVLLLIALAVIFWPAGCAQVLENSTSSSTNAVSSTVSSTPAATTSTLAVYKGYREYYPNTDGYSWTYVRTFSDGAPPLTEKVTYSGTTSAAGTTVQIAVRETIPVFGPVSTSESYFRVTDSGVYGLQTVLGTQVLALIFKFPLYVGSSTLNSTVLALEDVTVPSGTFSRCFKIRSSDSGTTYYSWLAPNVGMVRAEKRYLGTVSTAELIGRNF